MSHGQPDVPTTASPDERIAFLVDVDNTLLDNDAAKDEIDRRMLALLGPEETARFWDAYEKVRRTTGRVAIPETLVAYLGELPPGTDPVAAREQHRLLADILIGLPYREYVFPGAIDALARLREIGRVAILTEGDPAYQATKVARSGLADPVDGYVFVCPNKSVYLAEVAAIFPADRMVLVEDKPDNIATARRVFADLGIAFSGIFVRQGKYAARSAGETGGAELVVNSIADLAAKSATELSAALRPGIVSAQ